MLRRLDKFKQIQQIKGQALRKKAEKRFIEEQALTVAKFISEEKKARSQLKNWLILTDILKKLLNKQQAN